VPVDIVTLVQIYSAATNEGDFERAASVFAPDGRLRDHALARVYVGRDEIRKSAAGWGDSWPTTMHIVELHANEHGYAHTWYMDGTAAGPLVELGLDGSGQRWTLRGASSGQVTGHAIAEHRSYWNLAELLAQFGQGSTDPPRH
jgi:hypothetical protein